VAKSIYTFICTIGDHSFYVGARSRRKAETLLQEHGWVKQQTGWVCDTHRDKLWDRYGTWSGIPREGAGIFMLDEQYMVRILDLRVTVMPESVMGFDKPVLSMHYEVLPVEVALTGTSTQPTPTTEVWSRWHFDVRDDVGTEYEVQSGASGFRGPNRTIYDSDIDFEPSVSPHANWIEIRFMDPRHLEQPIYTLRADLPLLASRSES
jgi:hypothetical protein